MTASTSPRVPPWEPFFFRPRSTAPMTLVRIGWGATAMAWAISLLPDIDPFFVKDDLLYERTLSPGAWNVLPHLPGDHAGLIVCLVLLAASLATMVGWHTRASSVLAVLMMVLLQRANTVIFNSGDLVLRHIGVCVALAPCGLLCSLDARRDLRKGRVRNLFRAPYAMRFLQLSLALGYFLSAWTKARGNTWNDGTAIARSLRIEDLQRYVAPEWLFEQTVLLNLFTWATLLFEATFGILVWNRRLRPWVIGTGIAFHLGIDLFLDIGFFSVAIFLGYLAFVPDEAANRIVRRFDKRALEERAEDRELESADEPDLVVPAGGVGGRGSAGAPHPGGDPAPPVADQQ
jgi:Vitamin K-dependent gamma-carboxylase